MDMRIFSYIVARDYGFAPNPFYEFCTLATCKPAIKNGAAVGDLIIGTGSVPHGLAGHLVYAMRVTEILTFQQYWSDSRFLKKRPNLHGSTRDAYGDNIYEFVGGTYVQHDSHHSLDTGEVNLFNLNKDTGADAVLISGDYVYYGSNGPQIPQQLRTFPGYDLCASTQGHRCKFPAAFVKMVDEWFKAIPDRGIHGIPADWD